MPIQKVKAYEPNDRFNGYLLDFVGHGICTLTTDAFLLFYERRVSENHLPVFNQEGFTVFYVDLSPIEIELSIRMVNNEIKNKAKSKPKNLFCKEYLNKQKSKIRGVGGRSDLKPQTKQNYS